MVAAREKHGGQNKNRWKVLRSRVMRCGVNDTMCPTRRNVQQKRRCSGCSKVEYCLWACLKKAAHPVKGEVQPKVVRRTEAEKMTKEVKYVKCGRKEENTVWIPESVTRDKVCLMCEKEKGKVIKVARPEKKEVLSCWPVKFWLNK